MERLIYKELLEWKNKKQRKPLILNGARQVGKTYILKEFAEKEYADHVFFSLDRDASACQVFKTITRPDDLLLALSALSGKDIVVGKTVLILDEIQECQEALTALKFFYEDMPELDIVVAGSLLGLSLHRGASFPVGKVDMLYLYPMNFEEFLLAMGHEMMVKMMHNTCGDQLAALDSELVNLLRQYYFVGGMPAAVLEFVTTKQLQNVRQIQKQILQDYRRDFSKHAPEREVPRINLIWDSIPSQLARENKKFIFGALRKGARANDYEMALEWLADAGLIYKVTRASKAAMPLKFYEERNAFKLFMLDIGLMGAMVDAPANAILVGDSIFQEYKGAFTELYVHNELRSRGCVLYYHSVATSTIEIDFMMQTETQLLAIEVKAEENVKSKSLKTFVDRNSKVCGVRISMKPKKKQEWMVNLPLYAFVDDLKTM